MSNPMLELGYRAVLKAGGWMGPGLRSGFYTAGLAVSPALALTDESRRQRRPMLRSTVALALLVLLFSLGFNAFFSLLEGRLWFDADPRTINFLEDKWNLWLYLLICPAYVALSLQIIMVSSRYGATVRGGERPESRIEAGRSPAAISLCLAIAAFFAAKYIADVAIGPEGHTYWFNDRVGGVRVLNVAGVYYALMTFGFLSITIMALLNYLSVTQASLALANGLTADDCADVPAMRGAFLRFKQAYVYGRWLIAVFMIHTVIWSRSPLAKTENIHIAGAALVLAAVLLTAIPALHLDRKLAAAAEQCGLDLAEAGIEPVGAKKWLPIADTIIGLGFLSTLWGFEPVQDSLTWLFGERQM